MSQTKRPKGETSGELGTTSQAGRQMSWERSEDRSGEPRAATTIGSFYIGVEAMPWSGGDAIRVSHIQCPHAWPRRQRPPAIVLAKTIKR